MSLIVKICGLSTRETLDVALQAGADMDGFEFFPPSRRHEADARAARAQLADLRAGVAAQRADLQHLPALKQIGGYGSGGRDKQGATL